MSHGEKELQAILMDPTDVLHQPLRLYLSTVDDTKCTNNNNDCSGATDADAEDKAEPKELEQHGAKCTPTPIEEVGVGGSIVDEPSVDESSVDSEERGNKEDTLPSVVSPSPGTKYSSHMERRNSNR